MSDYVRNKVIRIRITEAMEQEIVNNLELDDLWDLEYCPRIQGKFKIERAPTVVCFLDCIIDSEYGADSGDWGKTRALYENELIKYKNLFTPIHKDLKIEDARLVEYSYYDCCEAPDYFDETTIEDPFYKEI